LTGVVGGASPGSCPQRIVESVFHPRSIELAMQPSDGPRFRRLGAMLSRFCRRNSLWLLLGCYALATVFPAPGRAMRDWSWTLGFVSHDRLTLPLMMLALMLFCAALLTDVSQVRAVGQRPGALLWGLLAVWLGPALLVIAAGWLVPWAVDGDETAGLLVGLALIASMPVANSSVAWTHDANGNLALSLALVLVSISLCPWLTPRLLGWLGLSLLPAERAYCDTLVTDFSGGFFVLWVIFPTLLGMAGRLLLGPRRVEAAAAAIRVISLAALLLLNYTNAAIALPNVFSESRTALLVSAVLLSVALSGIGLLAGWGIARLLRLPADEQNALLFGISMKHTGLALLLAGEVLAHQQLAILIIVLATLVQHLMAGVVQWQLQDAVEPPVAD
jgi:BASS family bile acid:Na+ symporter